MTKPEPPMKVITVRMTEQLHNRVRDTARRDHRSVNAQVNILLETGLATIATAQANRLIDSAGLDPSLLDLTTTDPSKDDD